MSGYQQIRVLKRGGFGAAVLARQSSGQLVCLKLIENSQLGSAASVETEVMNQLRLRHPHVVSLNEVFLTEGHLVMVLEYVAGGDLADHVMNNGSLPEDEARWIFQQVLFALEFCHRLGVAHRDVKLENVLLDGSPRPIVKLADFGLSTECSEAGQVCHDGVVGSPQYFAPEVLDTMPGGGYDAKAADVWSCGVLLHAMLTGEFPFHRPDGPSLSTREGMRGLVQRILYTDYAMPSWLSQDCQSLLSCMLQRDPCDRPSVRALMRHPWFSGGPGAQAMLQCNDFLVASCLAASSLTSELGRKVHAILEKACMGPATPQASAAQAPMASSGSESSDAEVNWAPT